MKIKELHVKCHGLEFNFEPKDVNIMLGDNGTGKTTFQKSLWANIAGVDELNGADFATDITYLSEQVDSNGNPVEELRIERSRIDGKSYLAVNGKTVRSIKAVNQAIEALTGVETDVMKAIISEREFRDLPGEKLTGTMLRYVPEKLTRNVMEEYVKDAGLTKDEQDVIMSFMPKDESQVFGIDILTGITAEMTEQKKAAAAAKKNCANMIAALPASTRPREGDDEETLKAAYRAAVVKEATFGDSKENEARTEKKKKHDEWQGKVAEIKNKLASCTVQSEPDRSTRDKMSADLQATAELRTSLTAKKAENEANVRALRNSVNAVKSRKCPINASINCATDMSVFLADAEKSILESTRIVNECTVKLRTAATQAMNLQQGLRRWDDADKKWRAYMQLKAQEAALLNAEPEKPEEAKESADVKETMAKAAQERQKAERALENFRNFKRSEELGEQLKLAQGEEVSAKDIIAAVSEKGVIRRKVIEYYFEDFQETIRKRSNELQLGYYVQFNADDGVKFMVKTPHCDKYLDFDSLSSGEQIITTILMVDMLAQLTGARWLFIDNVERLDANALRTLAQMLQGPLKKSYDHIFVTGVGHAEVRKALSCIT